MFLANHSQDFWHLEILKAFWEKKNMKSAAFRAGNPHSLVQHRHHPAVGSLPDGSVDGFWYFSDSKPQEDRKANIENPTQKVMIH